MSALHQTCLHILAQLRELVENIHPSDFHRPSRILRNNTVGQHVRHTLEFFRSLEKGFHEGIIDYDNRPHDRELENDKIVALVVIDSVITFIKGCNSDKILRLKVNYDINNDAPVTVDTNAFRELIYNIEHAIHHMAMIRIGITEVAPYIELSSDFGVAASTIRYRQESLVNSRQK